MPIQHSPPERQTRSQAQPQAVLTPTPRAPLDGTPEVPQLRAHLDRGPRMEGAASSRKEGRGPRRSSSFSAVVGRFPGTSRTIFRSPGKDGEEKEENSVEEEESYGTEGVPAPVGHPVTWWNVIYNLPVLIGLSTGLIAFSARVPSAEVWQTAL
ncbi:hypothetical protein O181_093445 [Austropuccinia psidii MF-1]|uniref:Uncharacterized protein n=1 Tax=Austropuccinia psidii MF-1 TaxID=1389203 RepID=A0A9Q3PA38_9BASI|nr:hypothetical protein [Austropuccinia psidii MF-1]